MTRPVSGTVPFRPHVQSRLGARFLKFAMTQARGIYRLAPWSLAVESLQFVNLLFVIWFQVGKSITTLSDLLGFPLLTRSCSLPISAQVNRPMKSLRPQRLCKVVNSSQRDRRSRAIYVLFWSRGSVQRWPSAAAVIVHNVHNRESDVHRRPPATHVINGRQPEAWVAPFCTLEKSR